MAFDPKSFIEVSNDLVSGSTQAHWRSVINRAYYGAFGYIRNGLKIFIDGPSVHVEVYTRLKNSGSLNRKLAGKKLEALFKERKRADYNYDYQFPNGKYDSYIKDAMEAIRLFEEPDEDDNEADEGTLIIRG